MGFDLHSGAELAKAAGGEKNVKDFGVQDELHSSLKEFVGKAIFKGSNEKDGAYGVDGFSVGETSLSGDKKMVASASKDVADAVRRIGGNVGEKLDLSASLNGANETVLSRNKENVLKISGDLVASYTKAKSQLGDSGQKSEGGLKNFDNFISQITKSRS